MEDITPSAIKDHKGVSCVSKSCRETRIRLFGVERKDEKTIKVPFVCAIKDFDWGLMAVKGKGMIDV
jgi:hypothetical protein